MEHLDHRQLLSVGFTGNVEVDFPETLDPGVVILEAGPDVIRPLIPPALEPIIRVSGLEIEQIRMTYHREIDTLAIGLAGPDNQKTGQRVIMGDTDNNLNEATVDPAVLAIEPAFIDFADLGGSETMGAFLDLTNDGFADIVAGVPNLPGRDVGYEVAQAIVNPLVPTAIPEFGIRLPQFEGNVFLVNDPRFPDFEFSIVRFSEMFELFAGEPLTPDSVFRIGAFGNSADDNGISEAFFPSREVRLEDMTPLPPPPPPTLVDLAIEKLDEPDPVFVGEPLTYTLNVTNFGPDDATNVIVSDVLPEGAIFVTAETTQGIVSEAGGIVTANVGLLPPTESFQITIVVIPTIAGTAVNVATVVSEQPDINPADNCVVTTTLVIEEVPPPPICPPLEPKVLINPHTHRILNTAHQTFIRVNIFGSPGFDVAQIDPATVRLGGASPIMNFIVPLNQDPYPDATFVFRGTEVDLPPGLIDAEVTGQFFDGTEFRGIAQVFNRTIDFFPEPVMPPPTNVVPVSEWRIDGLPRILPREEDGLGRVVDAEMPVMLRPVVSRPAPVVTPPSVVLQRQGPGANPVIAPAPEPPQITIRKRHEMAAPVTVGSIHPAPPMTVGSAHPAPPVTVPQGPTAPIAMSFNDWAAAAAIHHAH